MSLNHIIQSSVPDDEALDVKFKDLELTGDVYTNGKLYKTYFSQRLDRLRTGETTAFQQMLYNVGAKGSTTIPANSLRIGSILKLSIKGKVRNQISATSGSFNFRFNIGLWGVVLAFPVVPTDLETADFPFTLTFEAHIKTATEIDTYMHYNNYPHLTGRVSKDLMAYNSIRVDPFTFSLDEANNVEALVQINGLNSSDAWVNTQYGTIEVLY